MVHDSQPASVRQELATITEQSARRNPIQQPDHPLPRVLHLEQLSAPRAKLLDHSPEMLLRHVDHQLLVRLQTPSTGSKPRDLPRTSNLELVTLTTHRLHQDGKVQLTSSRHAPSIRGIGVLHPQRNVALQFLHEALTHLS